MVRIHEGFQLQEDHIALHRGRGGFFFQIFFDVGKQVVDGLVRVIIRALDAPVHAAHDKAVGQAVVPVGLVEVSVILGQKAAVEQDRRSGRQKQHIAAHQGQARADVPLPLTAPLLPAIQPPPRATSSPS